MSRTSRWSQVAGAAGAAGELRARVVGVEERAVAVELARGARGVVPREALPFLAGRPLDDLLGQTLRVIEVGQALSARAAALARCRRALEGGRTLRGRIVAAGAAGLLLDLGGARGFVPAGALPEGPRPVPGERWRGRPTHVTDHLCVLGTEPGAPAAPGPGGTITGVVESVGAEGAWLRLEGQGPKRALAVHDELGWSPRPRVSVGETLTGAVLDFTMSGPRVSVRALQPAPWPAIALELPPGTPVLAAVLATDADGAHVRLVDQPHAEAVVPAVPGDVRPGDWLDARVDAVDVSAGQLALCDVTTRRGPPPGTGAPTA